MRFHIRERAWSLTEAFVVRDDAGQPVFEVRGKFFHIGDDLVMFDIRSGQELVHIKQRLLSLLPHYEIYRNGKLWASVRGCPGHRHRHGARTPRTPRTFVGTRGKEGWMRWPCACPDRVIALPSTTGTTPQPPIRTSPYPYS